MYRPVFQSIPGTWVDRWRLIRRFASEVYAVKLPDVGRVPDRANAIQGQLDDRRLSPSIVEWIAFIEDLCARSPTAKENLTYDGDTKTEIDPKYAYSWNQLAWLLATCPSASIRDARRAIAAVTTACELTKWGDANYLDTLAAAYAEQGEFAKAVEHQAKALKIGGDEIDRKDFENRLHFYESGQPYRVANYLE